MVTNLFSNFLKNYIVNVQHIHNWHQWRGVDWCHYHQLGTRGKVVIWMVGDYKRLVHEGITIVEKVNEVVANNWQLFLLVVDEDPQDV